MTTIKLDRFALVEMGWISEGGIILPKCPLFRDTLNQSFSPDIINDLKYGGGLPLVKVDSNGLFEQLPDEKALDDYMLGGEWEQSLAPEDQQIFFPNS